MIERLTMFAIDRRALRGRGVAPPEPAAITAGASRVRAGDARAGTVVLRTCERFEVYVSGDASGLREIIGGATERRGLDAARHLLRVASGLESRLVGETHVLGQVRRAGDEARDAGLIGSDLARLLSLALRCGKRVRRETSLGRAGATYAVLAARQVGEHLAGRAGARVGIVGTGGVAMEVGEALRGQAGVGIVVFGRHAERTGALANHLEAAPAPIARLQDLAPTLDALVCVTSAPRPVVRGAELAGARPGLLLIDLGMPANADAAARTRPGLIYRGLDDVAPADLPARTVVGEAEAIVETELTRVAAHGHPRQDASSLVARRVHA